MPFVSLRTFDMHHRGVIVDLYRCVAAVVLMLSCCTVHAQQPPGPKTDPATQKAVSEKAAPIAVPLAELRGQAEAATLTLREITTRAAVRTAIQEIDRDVPTLVREIDVRTRENE